MEYLEQIKAIEEELRNTKYNKATQHHVGLLKAKIARLKEKQEARSASKGGAPAVGSVRKSGDATVAIVGFPSVGKSTLLNALTGAKSKIASYEFTTLKPVPGVMLYNKAKVQIVDLPGLITGAASGKGRGKEVISTARSADLILILLEAAKLWHLKALERELNDAGIRVNQKKPDVVIRKTIRGGISVSAGSSGLSQDTVKSMLKEFKIVSAEVIIREPITIDQLIDVIEGNRKYVEAVIAANKADVATQEQLRAAKEIGAIPVSAETGMNMELLKKAVFDRLRLSRVYLKQLNKKPDMEEPLIMKEGCTVQDVCEKLHKEFVTKFKFARVWGKSAKFPGQKFMLNHVLKDGDVLEIHLR